MSISNKNLKRITKNINKILEIMEDMEDDDIETMELINMQAFYNLTTDVELCFDTKKKNEVSETKYIKKILAFMNKTKYNMQNIYPK